MSFFEVHGPSCASSYRSISRRFFGWAEEQDLPLDSLRPEDLNRFHVQLWNEAGPNLASSSFSVIKRLFASMHERGGSAINLANGIALKRYTPFKKVRIAFCEQWGADATEQVTQAAMEMIAPACIGTFSLKAIRGSSQ
jgi:hypothetical protein